MSTTPMYGSDRANHRGDAPIHRFDLRQTHRRRVFHGNRQGAARHRRRLRRARAADRPVGARPLRSQCAGRVLCRSRRPPARQHRNAARLASRHRPPRQSAFRGVRPDGKKLPRAERRRAGGDGAVRRADQLQSAHTDLARLRSRLSRSCRQFRAANERVSDEPAERNLLQPGDLHQHQSRPDAALWRRDHRQLAGDADAAVQVRRGLYPRGLR